MINPDPVRDAAAYQASLLAALGCIDHIVDGEVVMAGRYRWTLAHDEPEIIGYDQDLWIARLHARPTGPGSRSIANVGPRAWT